MGALGRAFDVSDEGPRSFVSNLDGVCVGLCEEIWREGCTPLDGLATLPGNCPPLNCLGWAMPRFNEGADRCGPPPGAGPRPAGPRASMLVAVVNATIAVNPTIRLVFVVI